MDVDIYLHQMAYSFMRNPKIYTALEDTGKIAGGTLGRVIEQAMDELEYGMGEDVYANALYIIEKEYNCSRIRTLHKFIIGIEREVEGIRMHLECFLMTLTGGLKEYTGRSLKSRM